MDNYKLASGKAGGIVLLMSLFLTACDSGSDADELQSLIEVASSDFTALQLSTISSIIEIDQSLQIELNALTEGDSIGMNVADSAVWTVNNPDIATVDQSGLLTGLADGMVDVRAQFGPLSSVTSVVVSAAELVSIEVTAAADSVNECGSVQLTALGSYADGLDPRNITNAVFWEVDGAATVGTFDLSDPSGFARTSGFGQLSVSASRNGISVNPSFSLEVLDNLEAITIQEPAGTLSASNDVQLSALASYSDSFSADITDNASWSVSDTTVATIDNTLPSRGLLDASQTGTVTVSATCGAATGMLTLLSGDPTRIESISFERDSPFVFTFDEVTTLQLAAIARLESQQEVNVSEDSEWTLVEEGNSLNELSNSSGSRGELTIRGTGTIIVEVEYTGDEFEGTVNIPRLEINVQ